MSAELNVTEYSSEYYMVTMSQKEGNLTEQLAECLLQVSNQINDDSVLLKQVVFIDAADNETFYHYQSLILDYYRQSEYKKVPVTIVAQPPANGQLLCIESWISSEQNAQIEYKEYSSIPYIIYSTKFYTKLIVANIQHKQIVSDIYQQSQESFKTLKAILDIEDMKFSDIIRQWNYIENITGNTDGSQHYQMFNDVRSLFYDQGNFINGYPAATGIGSAAGGLIIDFIALKPLEDCKICSIKSPVQKDAHQYSKEVLAFGRKDDKIKETTPKFERAKAMLTSKLKIYISGTAAIIGQASQASDNAFLQTKLTIENIFSLVERNNISDICTISSHPKPSCFRVYIKNKKDSDSVKECFESLMPDAKAVYVIADVCRPELLVEIEGVCI
jgi:Putative translation initiation inhibitor, yjgF family